jgi:hypothetical protein
LTFRSCAELDALLEPLKSWVQSPALEKILRR